MKIADFRPWVITTHRQLADAVKEILGAIPWHNAIQPTLSAPKVPIVLHEPAILAGYRVPYKSWSYYFLSLFQIHNEAVNVWSHLIGSLVILHKLYGYFHEFDIYTDDVLTVLLVFGISCVICLLTSAVVHLLHGKSPYVHFVAFCIDYIGATFGSFGAGYACFYGLSDEGFYKSFDNIFLYLLTIASYLNCLNLFLAKIWYGHDPHNMKRKYLFIGGMLVQALMNMAPFVPRYFTCYNDETCSMTSLNHLTTLTIVFILEAITFSAHQPEKRWPGKFDIVGHGHQMFHLLIVFNHAVILDSIRQDHVDGLTSHKETNLVIALGIMATMYVLDLVTLYLLSPLIPESLKKIEHAEAVSIKSQ